MGIFQLLIPWALLSYCSCWDLTIVHTNDMHAWLDKGSTYSGECKNSTDCFGGFPRVKFFADWAKKSYKNVLFLNAGDNFQGTPYYSLYKWKIIKEFVDQMGFDVMSLGNHEFDEGPKGLVPYLKSVKAPWICCNLITEGEALFKDIQVKRWIMFNVEGRKVAVIGYLTPETQFLADIGNLTLVDEIECLKESSEEARRKGADVVIALGHSGWDKDIQIAHEVSEIDVVVGGHSHTFHYHGKPLVDDKPVADYPYIAEQSSHKIVPMVQAYAYTKYVGFLNLTFDSSNRLVKATGNPVLMDQTIPEDKAMAKILRKWKGKMSDRLNQVIGQTVVDLHGEHCRMVECNIGNLVADAFAYYRKKKSPPGAANVTVAVINAGDIRASISRDLHHGAITLGALLSSLPFDNTLSLFRINGSEFRRILEHSVYRYDKTGANQYGEFLQVSGFNVVYDLKRPPGERVVSVKINCDSCTQDNAELNSTTRVDLVSTGFLSNGGDGYTMLKTARKQTIGDGCFNVIKNYIKVMSPVNITTQDRITIM